jgi:hypothetical protein
MHSSPPAQDGEITHPGAAMDGPAMKQTIVPDAESIQRLTRERLRLMEKLKQVDATIRLLYGTNAPLIRHGKLNRPPSFLNLGFLP